MCTFGLPLPPLALLLTLHTTVARMLFLTLTGALAFQVPGQPALLLLGRTVPRYPARAAVSEMGLFDAFAKAFDNKDYSKSPATYEQTNARASHILVSSEAECLSIKEQIAAGDLAFEEAALKFSSCNSAQNGGKLGKFMPGTMVPEFDEVVFGVQDTGRINPKNGADLYEPTYDLDVVHGPVRTKFGFHLIKIQTRNLAEFDFRGKEGKLGQGGADPGAGPGGL